MPPSPSGVTQVFSQHFFEIENETVPGARQTSPPDPDESSRTQKLSWDAVCFATARTHGADCRDLMPFSTVVISCAAFGNVPRWAREVSRAKSVAGSSETEVEAGRPERRPAPSAAASRCAILPL